MPLSVARRLSTLLLIGIAGPLYAQGAIPEDTGTAFSADIIDQSSPRYMRAVEATSEASQALDRALQALQTASDNYRFDGLDLNALALTIARVREELSPILSAEQRRLRYQTLQPDGVFMRPAGQ